MTKVVEERVRPYDMAVHVRRQAERDRDVTQEHEPDPLPAQPDGSAPVITHDYFNQNLAYWRSRVRRQ